MGISLMTLIKTKVAPPSIIYTSWSEIDRSARNLYERIRKERIHSEQDKPVCIIYPQRGGMGVGRLFSDKFRVNCVIAIDASLYKGIGKRNKTVESGEFPQKLMRLAKEFEGGWMLLVDDVSDTGRTLAELIRRLDSEIGNKIEFVTSTLDYKSKSIFKPDYYDREVNPKTWIVYPYELNETVDGLKEAKDYKRLRLLARAVFEKGGVSLEELLSSLPTSVTKRVARPLHHYTPSLGHE
jgi:hypothetical protein